MKQFCPSCGEWHDADNRFCPKCDVVMYEENIYGNYIKNNLKFKTIDRKKAHQIQTTGTVMLVIGIISSVLGWSGLLIIMIFADEFFLDDFSQNLFMIISFLVLVIGIILLFSGILNLSERNRIYHTFSDTGNNSSSVKPVSRSSNQPIIICPYCKSQNTIKIYAIDRMGSVLLVGAASGKIGKQWHCNDCKSDF